MAELITIYQDNIIVIFNKITKLLSIFTNLSVEKFDLHSKDIEINLREAERMLKQMDLELTTNNSIEPSTNLVCKKNYQVYKNKYDFFKKTFFEEKEKFSYTKKKEEMLLKERLTAALERNNSSGSEIQTQITKEKIAENSLRKLQNAKINALQIENVSKNVGADLEGQTQKLKSTQLKMQDLNENIESANNLLMKMFDSENRNKFALATCGIVLISVLFWILNSRM